MYESGRDIFYKFNSGQLAKPVTIMAEQGIFEDRLASLHFMIVFLEPEW